MRGTIRVYCGDCKFYWDKMVECRHKSNIDIEYEKNWYSEEEILNAKHLPSEINNNNNCKNFKRSFVSRIKWFYT